MGSSRGPVLLPTRRRGFNGWVRKIPWKRKWQSAPVLLPGASHGQRSLLGCSPWGRKRAGYDLVTKQQQQGVLQLLGATGVFQHRCSLSHLNQTKSLVPLGEPRFETGLDFEQFGGKPSLSMPLDQQSINNSVQRAGKAQRDREYPSQ